MYGITLVLFAIMATSAYGGSIMPRQVLELDGRIVGGVDTTIEQHPHQVSLRYWGQHMCGGSIIKPNVILSAAHCTNGLSASRFSIQYGSTVVSVSSSNVIAVKSINNHPYYNENTNNNDVSVIILKSDIPETFKPIALAEISPAPGTVTITTGWGATSEGGSTSNKLKQVSINIISRDVCQSKYKKINTITTSMLCAGVPNGGKDACQGDSGGPLVANNQLVGVVSWGVGCARPQYPGVFADVANLRSFIESVIN